MHPANGDLGESNGAPSVDFRTALAVTMQSSPGVYSVLAGSGLSTGAGIPTGWAVVQDLIRRVAKAQGVSADDVEDSPERWWKRTFGEDPRYDRLLEALTVTDPERQRLLRDYFDPPSPAGGRIAPTPAHHALAALSAHATIKVIVTTNFDHLIEHALDQIGLSYQVLANEYAIQGMTCLVHAPLTLVKVNGDYALPGMRNTPEELATYPEALTTLLARIFDEYGLLVVGWSGDYDTALANSIYACPTRRYHTYWATLNSSLTERARRLTDQRQARLIDTTGADEFLPDLVQQIERVERRAARRREPSALRILRYPPDRSFASDGWATPPLLQLRCITALGPATLEECEYIRTADRESILSALRAATLRARLASLATSPAVSAVPANADAQSLPTPLIDWHLTPSGYQTTERCSYRLGGDATAGVSALTRITLPNASSGSIMVVVDIAISIARKLRLGEVATLWRDGLVLTSGVLPDALDRVLPGDADPYETEVHAVAWTIDRENRHRDNDLGVRIDLQPLGEATSAPPMQLGLAHRLPGPLSEQQAAKLVVDSIEIMSLNAGYVNPTIGVDFVRQELGVPPG